MTCRTKALIVGMLLAVLTGVIYSYLAYDYAANWVNPNTTWHTGWLFNATTFSGVMIFLLLFISGDEEARAHSIKFLENLPHLDHELINNTDYLRQRITEQYILASQNQRNENPLSVWLFFRKNWWVCIGFVILAVVSFQAGTGAIVGDWLNLPKPSFGRIEYDTAIICAVWMAWFVIKTGRHGRYFLMAVWLFGLWVFIGDAISEYKNTSIALSDDPRSSLVELGYYLFGATFAFLTYGLPAFVLLIPWYLLYRCSISKIISALPVVQAMPSRQRKETVDITVALLEQWNPQDEIEEAAQRKALDPATGEKERQNIFNILENRRRKKTKR